MNPSTTTHLTATTRFVDAPNGIRYAYRRFGTSGGVPLVFLQHFRGSMDNWDPMLVDALAAEREVVLVDNAGVSSSGGETPATVVAMARDLIAFLDALGFARVDLIGFSLGGFVAQDAALLRPRQVRRLILAGTGPQGGPQMHGWREDIADAAREPILTARELLYIFFKHTETSQAAGRTWLGRLLERQDQRDVDSTLRTRDAQYDAVVDWGIPDHTKLQRLAAIAQPTFAANGDDDLMIPPRLTHLLGALIPNAVTKIYPDAGHGFLWQYPTEFAADVNRFLET